MNENVKITLGYLLICLLWGSTWLAIRIGLDYMTPIFSSAARFIVASFIIYCIMKFKGVKLQTDRNSIYMYIILSLFSFAVPFGLVYWAEQFVSSGLASIIFASLPFFVIVFTYFSFKQESIVPAQVAGVVLGFLGIVVIFSENLHLSLSTNMLGLLALLISAMIQAGIAVIVKKWGKHLNPLSMNFLPLISAGIIMLVVSFATEDLSRIHLTSKAVLSVLYLASFGTVASFTTYYWLMKRINIVILSLSSFITPIIAVILGWMILDEKLSLQTLIGSILVLVGILFANFSGLKKYLLKKSFKND